MVWAAALVAVALFTGAAAPDDKALLDAARRGDAAAVRSLLREGADANAAQGDGMTALHLAAQRSSLEVTKLLLGAGAKVSAVTRIGRFTPLHVAAEGAHLDVVQALLDAGADPAALAESTRATPLHLAAKALNGESTVRLLMARGAPVNAREASHGQTALMIAAAYGRVPTVRMLLEGGADPGIATTVVDVIQRLVIDKAARERLDKALEEVRNNAPDDGWNRPLTQAETQAAIEIQRQFLASREEIEAWIGKPLDKVTVDDVSSIRNYSESGVKYATRPIWEMQVGITGGMTALLHAAREGHIEAAQALLDGGADIDQVAGDGTSPLGLAALNGQFDLAMMLVARGAKPNLASKTDGIAPLFAVVQTQWSNFTGYPQPRAQDRQRASYLEVMEALLEAGADPNARLKTHLWFWEHGNGNRGGLDINGSTAFFRATMARDLEAMKLLAAHGADPNIPTVWGEVGMRAERQEDGRTGDDSGLPPMPAGTPNMYPIHAAAGGGALGAVAIDINAVPKQELNALRYLVEVHGANVNQRSSWGYTPMHYAAIRGDHAMIDYLLSKGAEINPVSRLGQTPVDMARGGGAGFHYRAELAATVRYMVDLGAEFRCKNTHFRGTGYWCAGAGVPVFNGIVVVPEEPTPPKSGAAPATPR
jgi:ankyrin repeat protein